MYLDHSPVNLLIYTAMIFTFILLTKKKSTCYNSVNKNKYIYQVTNYMNRSDKRKIKAAEMRFLRPMAGYTLWDKKQVTT